MATSQAGAAPKGQRLNRACGECTRRKIRCDGSLPCRNCRTWAVEDKCQYRKRSRRTNPSWETITQLTETLDARDQLLMRLLPAVDFNKSSGLSRESIERLLCSERQDKPTPTSDETSGNSIRDDVGATQVLNWADDGSAPEPGLEWSETQDGEISETRIGDALNGLQNIPQRQPRLYQAAASTGATLHALCVACPRAEQTLSRLIESFSRNQNQDGAVNPGQGCQTAKEASPKSSSAVASPPPQSVQNTALDAYFENFQAFYPMIDELWFRATLSSQERTDDGWVALLNMVLAIGSIAVGDDRSHLFYHGRVKEVLGYNTFASGNLEMLQALILLGGAYLHYVNSPNTASLVLGTAFQMAISLGLHREPSLQTRSRSRVEEMRQPSSLPLIEIRRRTWWSLVCADQGSGILSGKPKLNRWDPLTMDTALPTTTLATVPSNVASMEGNEDVDPEHTDWYGISLRYMAELAKIFTKMEHCMARISPITAQEVKSLDEQLQSRQKVHSIRWKHSANSCPKSVKYWHHLLRSQVLFTRMTFSRPLLVRLAEDPSSAKSLTSEDWEVVAICQSAASLLIDELNVKPKQSKMTVWFSTFFLFQACLVLLLSVALAPNLDEFDEYTVETWKQSIAKAMSTFEEMAPYRRPADRYGEVIQALNSGVCWRDNGDSNNIWPEAWTMQQDAGQTTLSDTPMLAANCWDWLGDTQDMATTGTFLDLFDNYFMFGQEGGNWDFLPDA